MSIKECAASIDFSYEPEDAQTNEDVFDIKFHKTEPYGKTISICGSINVVEIEGNEYISLPADLFAEVVDFLRSKRYISGQVVSKSDVKKENMRQMSSTALPVPNFLDGENPQPSRQAETEKTVSVPDATDIDGETDGILPVQSLSTDFVNMSSLGDDGDGSYEDDDIDMEEVEDEDLEEIKQAALEREQAKKNAEKGQSKYQFRKVINDSKSKIKQKIEESQDVDYDEVDEV